MTGSGFPRSDAETRRSFQFGHFSALLRLCGRWPSLLRREVPVSPWLGGQDRRRRTGSRFPAETQRRGGVCCLVISLRLCASAGDRVRYCVMEFLFHCGVGGQDRRRMTGSRFPRRDAETQRVCMDQRKIMCAAAGCSLMGLAKNALDAASVPGRTQPLRRKRQHPSAYANGSPRVGGLNAVDDTG